MYTAVQVLVYLDKRVTCFAATPWLWPCSGTMHDGRQIHRVIAGARLLSRLIAKKSAAQQQQLGAVSGHLHGRLHGSLLGQGASV